MLAASPAERLRTLRELLGLTQKQLEEVSGVGQSWISSVETGARSATEDHLEAIARATGTPLKFFSVQPTSVPLDSLRFRKHATASKKTTARVHAFYSESYRVAEALLTQARYPPPSLPYTTSEAVAHEQIEELAETTREALRLAPDKPIPHLTRALERGGVAVAPIVLANGEEDDQPTPGHFGVSYWAGVGEAGLIGYFPGAQGDRDRFTLAHELAHLVLHTYRPRTPHAQAEDEAHRFASALLLPRVRAARDINDQTMLTDYARLKATWGMSIQALIMRGHALGVVSGARKRSLFVQLSAKGWRKSEPVVVGREEPKLLWKLLERQYGDRPYRPAAEELAIHPTVLRSIAPTPQQHVPTQHNSAQAVVRTLRPRAL